MIASLRTKHAVSHEWERATHLRDYRAGRLRREEICDADFLLQAAALHHGIDSNRDCPVCGAPLRETLWIYGDVLGRRAGSARKPAEIAQIVQQLGAEFTVHRVEVCRACHWNHLLEAATVY